MITSKKMRRMSPDVHEVRRAIPSSWFTKSGPGIENSAKAAFRALDPRQRVIAINRGWIPESWFNLPPIRRRRSLASLVFGGDKPREDKPGVIGRAWNKLKSWFGGGK